jgi:hypothetical protein
MIKNISGGNGIQVDGGYWSPPYINQNSQNPMQGVLRINGSDMQVYDGSGWISIGGAFPTVSLNGAAYSAINWAQQKMQEEANIKALAEKHPAIADAVNTINEAYDKLKVVVALVEEENK